MKRAALLAAALALAACKTVAVPTPPTTPPTMPAPTMPALGVYFPGPAQFTVAQALHVSLLRVHVQVAGDNAAQSLKAAQAARAAGYRLIVSYFNACGPSPCPVADMAAYAGELAAAFAAAPPVIAVDENEEDDGARVYTVAQYEAQHTAFVAAAHAAGLKAANGGLTSTGMALSTWAHLRATNPAAADAFAGEAFPADIAADLPTVARPGPVLAHHADLVALGARATQLLAFYGTDGQDLLNFHVYDLPEPAILAMAQWAHDETGLPVICNEMGLTNPGLSVTDEALGGINAGLDPIIWFGPDGTGPGHAIGLADPTGTLRPGGLAFAAVVSAQGSKP